ncbi:MAG TPA: hypothetical protein V6D17_15095 [Candidatus Obscuribacterales bacterium]
MSAEENVINPASMDAEGMQTVGAHGRAPIWKSFVAACKHLGEASRDKSITIREVDKFSRDVFRTAVIATIVFLAIPLHFFTQLAIPCYVMADFSFMFAMGFYIVSRFGILTTLKPRNALICWHLMIGASLFTVGLFVNLIILSLIIYTIYLK